MSKPPPKRGRADPKQQAFKQYQARRAADGFEVAAKPTMAQAWNSFVGQRGQRLRTLLISFNIVGNPRYAPGPTASMALVRDVLQRIGVTIPDLPAMRLVEWFLSPHGGRPQGWREVPSSMAQIAANDGRAAVAVGVGPLAQSLTLAAVVCPDENSNPANPTVLMVALQFALNPGTVLQGFRGQPVRYFAQGQ